MNYYIVVEGEKSEKLVYRKWIKYLNPNLHQVYNINDVKQNNFIIYSGYGYPFYLDVIDSAIEDVNSIDEVVKLVIAVDSEEQSFDEKYCEIENYIKNKNCTADICIIVQHFCLETWALGNKSIISRNPSNVKLRSYLSIFNVLENDPELLPSLKQENMNRAQFALRYLKLAINEKYRNLSYSKNNPEVLLNRKYFFRLVRRYNETKHISSFSLFINAFK